MEKVALIIITGVISAIGINGAPTGEIDKDMILDKFIKIKENCLEHRESYKTQSNNSNINQILCVMVMSGIEVHNKDQFDSGRIKNIFNKKRNDDPFNYGKGEVHGEIQAIRLDNDIHKLIQTFTSSSKTAGQGLPYVFVYSYYIPCASISNTRYSCAEELATHARLNQESFNMLVGYSDIFEYTDQNLANGYLHQRGLFALVNLKKEEVEMGTDQHIFSEPQITVFQDKYHECISRECGDCGATLVRDKIDCLVQTCTSKSQERGPLTHLGMWFMYECLLKNKCCNDDKKRREQFEVVKCLLNIMGDKYKDPNTLLVLGKPEHDNGRPNWTPSDINTEWGQVYKDYQSPAKTKTLQMFTELRLGDTNQRTREIKKAHQRNGETVSRLRKPKTLTVLPDGCN